MQNKLELLLKKLNIEENDYSYFNDGTLDKIVGNKDKTNYNFYITLNTNLPYELYDKMNNEIKKIYSEFKEVKIIINVKNINIDRIEEYYQNFIEKYSIIKKSPLLKTFKDSKLDYNDYLYISVSNKAEEMKINSIKKDLEKSFNNAGFKIEIKIKIDKMSDLEILNEINKDLDVSNIEVPVIEPPKEEPKKSWTKNYEPKPLIVEKDNPDVIIGRKIEDEITRLDTVLEQEKQITIEAKPFADVDIFKTKNELYIVTLKLTDLTDSIYGKMFAHTEEEVNQIKKIKKGTWYKFRGSIKEDKYAGEITLQIRDVNVSNRVDEVRIDDAPVKRVELHAHTMMSGMDGITNLDLGKHTCELVEETIRMGYKGVAITDHSGCQGFPISFGIIKGHNKKISAKIAKYIIRITK